MIDAVEMDVSGAGEEVVGLVVGVMVECPVFGGTGRDLSRSDGQRRGRGPIRAEQCPPGNDVGPAFDVDVAFVAHMGSDGVHQSSLVEVVSILSVRRATPPIRSSAQ